MQSQGDDDDSEEGGEETKKKEYPNIPTTGTHQNPLPSSGTIINHEGKNTNLVVNMSKRSLILYELYLLNERKYLLNYPSFNFLNLDSKMERFFRSLCTYLIWIGANNWKHA